METKCKEVSTESLFFCTLDADTLEGDGRSQTLNQIEELDSGKTEGRCTHLIKNPIMREFCMKATYVTITDVCFCMPVA